MRDVIVVWTIVVVAFVCWFVATPNFISVRPAELRVDGYVPSLDHDVPVGFGASRYLAVTGELIGGPKPGRRSEIALPATTWEEIARAKEAFPVGAKISVFVDGRYPEIAFRSRALLWPYLIATGGGFIAMLFTIGVLRERRGLNSKQHDV